MCLRILFIKLLCKPTSQNRNLQIPRDYLLATTTWEILDRTSYSSSKEQWPVSLHLWAWQQASLRSSSCETARAFLACWRNYLSLCHFPPPLGLSLHSWTWYSNVFSKPPRQDADDGAVRYKLVQTKRFSLHPASGNRYWLVLRSHHQFVPYKFIRKWIDNWYW